MSDTNYSRSGFSVLKVLAVIGIVFIALIGGCVACTAGAVGAVANAQKQAEAKQVNGAMELMTATVSDLRPDGELSQVFTIGSKHTDLQRAEWEKRITGQVVEWTLPIYEVRKERDHYVVQTSASVMDNAPVGCFIHIYPQSEQDVAVLAALQLKSPIHFRGRIVGTSLRNLKITPAILVAEAKSAPAGGAPTSPAPVPAAPAVTVKGPIMATSLVGYYEENEVAADALYKGKVYLVRGEVGSISKGVGNEIYVTLKCAEMPTVDQFGRTKMKRSIRSVQCFLASTETAKAATLSAGQFITVQGTVSGLMMNVLLKNCTIVTEATEAPVTPPTSAVPATADPVATVVAPSATDTSSLQASGEQASVPTTIPQPSAPVTATALSGAVILSQGEGKMTYQKKCEKCGTLQSGRVTGAVPSRGSTLTSSFNCQKCRESQKLSIAAQ